MEDHRIMHMSFWFDKKANLTVFLVDPNPGWIFNRQGEKGFQVQAFYFNNLKKGGV